MKRTLLNTYPLSSVASQIAPKALSDLKSDLVRIPTFLGVTCDNTARRAQSVIIRSEAELLGLSSPRFALRVYLEGGGFMNCRRLEHLIENAAGATSGHRYSNGSIPESCRNRDLKDVEHAPDQVANLVFGQSCIADCLLPEPRRLSKNKYCYVDVTPARLFDVYAEPRNAHPPQVYTPYVKAIDFGGGLCAQAVCFMATSALSSHATSLCGLAEITAYAHADDCRELSLSGLTPAKMQQYFDRVGLRTTEQAPSPDCRAILSAIELRRFQIALRCYLQSNMPVIFPVDYRKMAATPSVTESIYAKNGYTPTLSRIPPYSAHAIILIGFSEAREQFIFHDPSVLPYMVADASALASVGCWRGAKSDIKDNGIILPVTHSRVRLPLLWDRQVDALGEIQSHIGLFTISSTLHLLLHGILRGISRADAFSLGHKAPFILSARSLAHNQLAGVPEDGKHTLANEIQKCVAALHEKRDWRIPRWLWYELHPNSVWIWDAELPTRPVMSLDLTGCMSYLVGIVNLDYRGAKPSASSIAIEHVN